MPTMRTLAAELGISHATVARALSGDPHVAPATRTRVLEAAARAGWHPDPVLSAAARRRWRREAEHVLVAFLQTKAVGEAFVCEVMASCASRGWICHPVPVHADRDVAGLRALLRERRYGGVLVGPWMNALPDLPELGLPAVALSDNIPGSHLSMVVDHLAVSIQMCWDAAVAAGHRRIGIAIGHNPGPISPRRRLIRTFAAGLYDASVESVPILDARFTELGPASVDWYRSHRPTAIIGLANVVRTSLVHDGVVIPQQCSYLDTHLERGRQVTGTHIRTADLALAAVSFLDLVMRDPAAMPPDIEIRVRPIWVPGATLTRPM
jgi:LacI family transcriptional regulator